ncbi:hypothetical protein G6011_06936 [Alternaria panax]|uniref:Uncharacterized protein n=1 Tax=Alternaria panax TaxID=48097 RepID=A0AAD4F944_9PLEO|nr:hypothetical protein G6011_06936 [Alternaria panax]
MTSNIHHIDATILRINSQPSQSELYPHFYRKVNGQLFDPLHPTQPEKVYATILDLNGNPIDRNKPYPVLHRTASGHLFQPKTPAVGNDEEMYVYPNKDPAKEEVDERRAIECRKMELGKMKGRDAGPDDLRGKSSRGD